jgi:hypothetical protein
MPRRAPQVSCPLNLGSFPACSRCRSRTWPRIWPPARLLLLLLLLLARAGGRGGGAGAPVTLVRLICGHALEELLLLLAGGVVGSQQDVAVGVLQLLGHARVALQSGEWT